jgi:hypothetical protein
MQCDGASLDEVLFHLHGVIERNGWAVIPVEPAPGRLGWAYTIGLTERCGHPELVVVGLASDAAGRLLNAVAGLIAIGGHLRPDQRDAMVIPPAGEVVRVHHEQLVAGLMAMWPHYYGSLGRQGLPLEALQLCVPLLGDRPGNGVAPPRLDQPAPRLAGR